MVAGGQRAPVKPSGAMNASRYIPNTSQSSLIVGVRVRPLLMAELAKGGRKDILRVIDGKMVVVLDPDESKDYLDQVQNRTKEKQYTFDVAFDSTCTNVDVYNGTVRDLISGVLYGINTTVFAYGATGSGKTYTMVGSASDPGLMILSLERIFEDRDRLYADEDFDVTCSYLEVYNETIYDLLIKNSGPLELREDPEMGICVSGLKQITVSCAADILDALEDGNRRRKTESTDANSHSSRSHAVLEISIRRTPKNHYKVQQLRAKLSLVDLAGSERAADTNNEGKKLRDGANINRSLLALANCINALGKGGKAGYVPYRNSKLTRLLKDGLSGNSRTAMITTVSASSDQYNHSINTLKYADRAKEIKTHVVQNVGTVESHVADYQRIIDNLQEEVMVLKSKLADRPTPPPSAGGRPAPAGGAPCVVSEDEMMGRIDTLVQEMNENIEERINLQKALFEIEDALVMNKYELKQLEEFLEAGQGGVKDITEARDRKADVLNSIKENEIERDEYKEEIAANEGERQQVQARIDQLVSSNHNVAFLNLVGTFRLQAVRLQELKFQMAVRDQIISEQREVIGNLWRIIDRSGMGRERVLDIAKQEGIIMDGFFQLSEDIPVNSHGGGGKENGHAAKGGRKKPESMGAGDLGTPNALLAGNRAKMRYQFWQEYIKKGDAEGGMSSGDEMAGPSPGGAAAVGSARGVPAMRGGTARKSSGIALRNGARGRELPAAGRRQPRGGGAGGGLASAPVRRRNRFGGAGIGDDDDRPSPSSRNKPAGARNGRGMRGSVEMSEAVAGRVARGANTGSAPPVRSAPVAAALNGVGNNATAPVVRSGRRAGQPAVRLSLVDPAALAQDLPHSNFGHAGDISHAESRGASSEASRRHDAIAAAMANHGVAASHVQEARPPLAPSQAPLSERLAKLRGRLGRRSEADGVRDLPIDPSPVWAGPASNPSSRGAMGQGLVSRVSGSPPSDALDVLKESIRKRTSGSGGA